MTALTASLSSPPTFNLETRIEQLQTEAENLYKNVADDNLSGITIKVTPDHCSFAAINSLSKRMYLHPLMVLTPDDIPPHLRIHSRKDLRWKNDTYIKEFTEWISKAFKIPQKNLKSLKKLLKNFYLNFWKDPEMFKRSRRFILSHEIGHVYHKHTPCKWDGLLAIFLSTLLTRILMGFVCSIYLIIIFFLSIKIHSFALKHLRQYYYRNQEHQADLTALKATNDFEAAKYFFTCFAKCRRRIWKKLTCFEKISRVIFSPGSVFPISHPTPKARIEYLQNHLA